MASERPIYWGPEYLLEAMRDGETPSEIIRRAASDCPSGPAAKSYWNDIHSWRQDAGFRDRYERAQGNLPTLEQTQSEGRPQEFSFGVQRAFLEEMIRHGGDYRKACYEVGVGVNAVLARINPKSASYDLEFHEMFAMAEAGLHDRIYAEFEERAFEDGDKRDNWLFYQFARSRAPHLFDPRRVVEIEGTVRHNHMLSEGFKGQLQQQRKALMPPASSSEEAAVIDVEFEEVKG